MAFDEPVVDHWLEWEIAQTAAGSTEKDRSDDRTLQRQNADEKLRNIGNKPQGSKITSPSGPSPQEEEVMAERRIQTRTGRRDRFRGGEGTRGQQVEHHKAEIKRRSRSEGPHNRVSRSKDDESRESFESYPKNEKIVGPIWAVTHSSTATRVSRYSPPLSDDGGFVHVQEVAGSDTDSSDSDRARKIWTKNPLVVRKTRRTGRSEKRQSNIENGFSQNQQSGKPNRESYVYYGSGQDKSDSSGTGSLKGNKYQKLEELRRKRIDIQVTSDEEVPTTPASRISRLRQRAIQSGLGKQERHSAIEPTRRSVTNSEPIRRSVTNSEPTRRSVTNSVSSSYSQKPSSVSSVSSVQNGGTKYSNQGRNGSTNVQPSYQVSSMISSPQVLAPKSFANRDRDRDRESSRVDNVNQNQFVSSQNAKRQSHEIKPFDQKGFSDSGIQHSDLPANFTVQQTQHNISEPKSQFFKSAYCSSPEVTPKRFLDRQRVPSADSIYDGAMDEAKRNMNRQPMSTYHNVGHGFVYMRPASGAVMELPQGDTLTCPTNCPTNVSSVNRIGNPNDVVELRLKTNRVLDRPPSQGVSGIPAKLVINRVNSDDSLDELIESNIQYLDREIDKSKKKTQISKSSSLPDARRFSGFQMQDGVIVPVQPEIKFPFSSSQSQGLAEWKVPSQPHVTHGNELQFHIPVGSGNFPPEIFIANQNRIGSSGSVYSGQTAGQMGGQTGGPYGQIPGPIGTQYGSGSLLPGSMASVSSHSSGSLFPTSHQERKLSYDSRAIYTLPGAEFHDRDMSKSDTQLNSASTLPTYRTDAMYPSYNQPYSSSSDQMVQRSGFIPPLDRGMFSDVEYNIEVADRVKKWEKYMKKRSDIPNDDALMTIQEQDIIPRDLRRSVFLEQRLNIPESPTMSVGQSFTWSGVSLKPSSSDPTIHLTGDPHLFSKQTNRMFHVIQEPITGAKYHTTANSVSSIYMPGPQRASPGLMSAADLRKHMVANKQPIDFQPTDIQPIQNFPNQNFPNPVNCRYQELDELQEAKSETVRDLCKMFDLSFQDDGTLLPEDQKPARLSPSQGDSDTNWTQLISDLETKIKETEVWSPEMESQEGDLVSIERVKARTLQTIPFSEDPFWKEIEEMTSFEKLFKPEEMGFEEFRSANPLEFASSQSSTLPSQPRMSARDRLTRSKSLYTPNITPLTIAVDKYNGPNALDDVLEDIRLSLEKQSPKVRKGGDSSDSHRSSPGPSYGDVQGRSRSNVYWERKPVVSATSQSQGLLTYANQTQSEAKQQDTYPGMEQYPNVVNGNYQLDPTILKQKLLRTGLVDEQRLQAARQYQNRPSPLIIPPPPQFYAPAPQPLVSQPLQSTRQSEEKRNEVNRSMEELRQLALDVEGKVTMIKSKIVRADEKNLDKILLTLKKFAPTIQGRSPEPKSESFDDFYVKKKSKLSEALFELDKIYTGLELDDSSMVEHVRRQDYPPYRRPSPIGQQKQDEKPEQSSTISFHISKPVALFEKQESKPEQKTESKPEQKPEQRSDSDFDAIQRSFQAILDEVNNTSPVKTVSSVTARQTESQTKPTIVSSFQQVEKSPEIKRRNIVSSAKTVFQPSVQSKIALQKKEDLATRTAVSSKIVDMTESKQNASVPVTSAHGKIPTISSLKSKVPPEKSPKPKRHLQPRTSRTVSSVTLTPAPALVPPETSPKPRRQLMPKTSSAGVILTSSPTIVKSPATVVQSSATVSMPRPKLPTKMTTSQIPAQSTVPQIPTHTSLSHLPTQTTGSHIPMQTTISHIPTRQFPKTSSSVTSGSVAASESSSSSLDMPQRENLAANVSKLMQQTGQSQSVSITLKTPAVVDQPANAASMQAKRSPRERRSRGRFRSKNPDLVEDDVAIRKARSKSTPRIDSQTGVTPSPTSADYMNPRESTPPQSRIRIRAEKEADLMHDDMAYRSLRKDVAIEPAKMPMASSAIEIELKSQINSASATPKTKPKFNKTVDLSKVKNVEKSPGSSPTVGSPKLKTVETQTSADEQKSSRGRFSKRQEDRRGGKRKMGRGIAMMLEIFSSSDDDRRMRPLHTRSAPDLSLLSNDDDDDDDDDDKVEVVNGVYVTSSSCQSETQDEIGSERFTSKIKDSVDFSENFSEIPGSPTATNKPPAHPIRRLVGSPEKISEQNVRKDVSGSDCDKFGKFSVRTRQGRSSEREVQSDTATEKPERPKSFHELLAGFERDEKRLHILKNLRKCASEDTIAIETVMKKTYQSEPYHSEPDLRQSNPRIPSQEGRHSFNGSHVELLAFASLYENKHRPITPSTLQSYGYDYKYVSCPRGSSLDATEPFSKIYANTDTTMSRYTSGGYDSGSRRYDTGSSYKSYDSGYRRNYGLSGSSSSYTNPRSYSADSSSTYTPGLRSYTSGYSSRNGGSDSVHSTRINTRTSGSKRDDSSTPTRDLLSSRNGNSSPRTSIPRLSTRDYTSTRSSYSSEPSLERETSLSRDTRHKQNRDRRSDSGSERDLPKLRDIGGSSSRKNDALEEYRASRKAKENNTEELKSSWRSRIGLEEYKSKSEGSIQKPESVGENDSDRASVRRRHAFKESALEHSSEGSYRSKFLSRKPDVDESKRSDEKCENGSVDGDHNRRSIRRRHAFKELSEESGESYRSKYLNRRSGSEESDMANSSSDKNQKQRKKSDSDIDKDMQFGKSRSAFVPYERKKENEVKKSTEDTDVYIPFSDRKKKNLDEDESPYLGFSDRYRKFKSEENDDTSKPKNNISTDSEYFSAGDNDHGNSPRRMETESVVKESASKISQFEKEKKEEVGHIVKQFGESDVHNEDETGVLSRANRIARYKEERRRQMATISNLPSSDSQSGSEQSAVTKPSLFQITAQNRGLTEKNDSVDKLKEKSVTEAVKGGNLESKPKHRRRLPDVPVQSIKEKEQILQDFIHSQCQRYSSIDSQSFDDKPSKHSPVTKPPSATSVRRASSLKVDNTTSSDKSYIRRRASSREFPDSQRHVKTSRSSPQRDSPVSDKYEKTITSSQSKHGGSSYDASKNRTVNDKHDFPDGQHHVMTSSSKSSQKDSISDKYEKPMHSLQSKQVDGSSYDSSKSSRFGDKYENPVSSSETKDKSKESLHSDDLIKVRRSSSDVSKLQKSSGVIRTRSSASDYSRSSSTPEKQDVKPDAKPDAKPDLKHVTKHATNSKPDLDQLKFQQIASYKHGEVGTHKSAGDRNVTETKIGKHNSSTFSQTSLVDSLLKPPQTPTDSNLLSSNLDDLLKQNANYLSDMDLELSTPSPVVKKSLGEGGIRRSLRKKRIIKSASTREKGEKIKAGAYSGLKRNSREESTSSSDVTPRAISTRDDDVETSAALSYLDLQHRDSDEIMRNRDVTGREMFVNRNITDNKDGVCGSTESDVFDSAPSTPPSRDYARKKKKDKSALRKSNLNKRDEDEDSSKNGSTSVDSTSMAPSRVSDLTSRSTITLTQHAPVPSQNATLITPMHASATSVSIISRAKALQDKVKKLNETKSAEPDDNLPRPIRRGKDFSQLLSKFSSSDASSSDPESAANTGRRIAMLCRQDKIVVSSSDESNTERSTPERTHSLRIKSPASVDSKVQRSSSFKSEFMKRRYSLEKSDKPDDELQAVLSQRSHIVEKQEMDAKRKDSKEPDSKVEKAEERKASEVEEVIADVEVLEILKARRKETDARNESQKIGDNSEKSSKVSGLRSERKETDAGNDSQKVQDNSEKSSNVSGLRTERKEKDARNENISSARTDIEKLDSTLELLNKVKDDLESPVSSSDLDVSSSFNIPSFGKKISSENISEALKFVHDVESLITSSISSSLAHSKQSDHMKESNVKGNDSVKQNSEISAGDGSVSTGTVSADTVSADTVSYTVLLNNSETNSKKINSETNSEKINSEKVNSVNKPDKRSSEEKRLSEEKDFAMPLAKEERWVTDRRPKKEHKEESCENVWNDNKDTFEITIPIVQSVSDLRKSSSQPADNETKSRRENISRREDDSRSENTSRSENESRRKNDSRPEDVNRHENISRRQELQTSGSDASSVTGSHSIDYMLSLAAKCTASVTLHSSSPETSFTVTQEKHSVPTTTNLRRAESLKEHGSPVHRTESFQKRKGILKRTPSLPKQSTPVIVDQELAKLLQKQKSKCDASSSEEEISEKTRTKSISALEEIDEVSRREKKSDESEDETSRKLSVTQRIFAMQKKIEEEKLAAVTPKSASQSGYTTPKSALKLWCPSDDEVTHRVNGADMKHTQAVSGEQLMEKLNKLSEQLPITDVAELKLVHSRREKFQQRQQRSDDWRRKTQPVTIEEVKQADSLESVFTFRSLIRRQSTKNIFDHLKEQEMTKKLPPEKKTEFPQHITVTKKKKKRGRLERYHTLPVTAEELKAIPEGQLSQDSTTNFSFKMLEKNDSRTDSGILSGSDLDIISPDSLRSLSLEMDINETDPACLSVSAKASMFRLMEEKTKVEKDKYKTSASGAKRYINRKKRERFRTQPITEDEVKTAAEMADRENKTQPRKPEVVNRTQSLDAESPPVEAEIDDELAGLSVIEKVKLFNKSKEKKDPAPNKDAPVPRRRARKHASRFATQPVTSEEVVKAASLSRVSPLAATLIRPPEPDILQGLPLAAQRELSALHAYQCLSQPGSRRSSVGDMDKPENKETSKEPDSQEVKGILKHQTLPNTEQDVRGILKSEKDKNDNTGEPKGILKRSDVEETTQKHTDVVGILKHSQGLSKSLDGTSKGILKSTDLQPSSSPESNLKQDTKRDTKLSTSENSLNRGILKSGSSGDKGTGKEDVINQGDGSGDTKLSKTSVESNVGVENGFHQNGDAEISGKYSDKSKNVDQGVETEKMFYISDDSTPERETTPVSTPSGGSSVKRKSRFQDRKSQGERYLTQPADLGVDKSPVSSTKKKYEGRHMTQPITPEEMKEAEAVTAPVRASSSINDRLNALKQSGESEWKKRLPKQPDYDTPVGETKLRAHSNRDLSSIRPSSIADRLSQIEVSKGGWKERVEEKDQSKFTVAGKLSKTGHSHTESPLVARLKQTPKREGITLSGDSASSDPSPVTSPSDFKDFLTPTKKIPLPKEIISDELAAIKPEKEKQTDGEKVEPVTVEIPLFGEKELDTTFFQTKDISEITDKVECNTDDFNEIFIQANDMLPAIRRVRPSRRKQARSLNPLKTMSLHIEVKQEYTQVDRGIAEMEFKRIKKEHLSKEAGFAQEALAGLASKENFSKIELRKADEATTPGTSQRHEPFKSLMLLHIKGRRTIQTRLVEPSCHSLNSGDCYILVTPEKIIHWVGEFSNVIEKAKSSEIASVINTKKDLGCRSSVVLSTVDEVKSHLGVGKAFWAAIGGQSDYQACGPDEEDELFESHLIKTNMVYHLVDKSLEPYEKYWGVLPKYEMLKKEEVLVFDFGGEMYLWMGTAVSMGNRKLALKLAQKLWDRGYDYSECNINPLCPLRTEEDGGLKMTETKRPDWALFGKISQNMETVLFREKFSDWPDTSRIIRCRGHSEEKKKPEATELKPYDVKKMLQLNTTPVSLVLEGSHVGRGTKWKEDMDGFYREFDVLTLSTTMWHVLEYDHYKLPDQSYGQFHDGDTYVVRWQYMITAAGIKSLKGHAARHSLTGREKCAYFFWQGNQSTINEKGASALMTVELDEERGPQVRVVQGKEPPCFLNLFKGKMISHIGKREEPATNTQGSIRFYCVRGEYDNELCLVEIPLSASNLRSRSSLIVLCIKTGMLYVWHGCKSLPCARKLAVMAAEQLKSKCPLEVGLHEDASIVITQMEEGEETSPFWAALDGYDPNSYLSLTKDPKPYTHTIRIFYMCSVSGVLEVSEVPNPSRSDLTTPFPFLQSDLYKASQRALFLIDNDHEVYLWQGWWPIATEELENVNTGSAQARFNVDRKCAIQTAIDYCREKRPDNPAGAYHVCAGVEPKCFTNLFPYWEVDTVVRESSLEEGKEDGYIDRLADVLTRLSKTRFTLEELQERPLPEGVDAARLEAYLDDEEFEDLMEMNREEFYLLPSWKQRQLKQQACLF